MGSLFKTKQEKELEMKLLINRTITVMQKQIKLLQTQKKVFFDQAATAREEGNEDLMCSSLAAYRRADAQLTHAKQSLVSFELASRLKENADQTAEFAKTMAVISREMVALTDEKSYAEIEQGFKKSMNSAKVESSHLETILAMGKKIFSAPLAEETPSQKEETPSAEETPCEQTSDETAAVQD